MAGALVARLSTTVLLGFVCFAASAGTLGQTNGAQRTIAGEPRREVPGVVDHRTLSHGQHEVNGDMLVLVDLPEATTRPQELPVTTSPPDTASLEALIRNSADLDFDDVVHVLIPEPGAYLRLFSLGLLSFACYRVVATCRKSRP
ncbi:MAG: hypothetical protein HXY18_20335 [Bryobacteraceae bacterium]|nr:hypothetical protein [Bryobacteraceae bacterium]